MSDHAGMGVADIERVSAQQDSRSILFCECELSATRSAGCGLTGRRIPQITVQDIFRPVARRQPGMGKDP